MTEVELLLVTLVETCESLYAERTLLEALLKGAKVPGWKKMFDQLIADGETRKQIHQQFQPLYDLVKLESQASTALKELLRVLPKREHWN